MPKTIRNEFDKQLTYENLMIAHKLSRKGKGYRKDVILFNLKQEEYMMWLYEKLKNKTYKHGGYTVFYITEPKVRKIRDKGKRKLKQKVKELKYYIREEKLTSKEAKKYLAGHLRYLKIANVNNLTKKIFYLEDE